MKRTNKSLAFLLALVMLLASCASTAPETEETAADGTSASPNAAAEVVTDETEPPEYTSPGADYDGATFTTAAVDYYSQGGGVWTAQDYCEAYSDLTGDPLNDAIYERNNQVSEELNVNMVPYSLTGFGNAGTEFRNALLSGETTIDICLMNGQGMTTMMSSGLLQNLYDVPNVDFTHSWWDETSVEEFNIMGALFAVTGDISLNISFSPITYFFSKKLIEDHQLEDPYTLVREGRWTNDKTIEMATAVASDVNGNGNIDLEEDHFGIAMEAVSMVYAVHAAGISLTEKDADGVPYVNVDQERASSLTEKLAPFYQNKNVTMLNSYISGYNNNFFDLFLPSLQENRVLFFNNQLLVALDLREMDSDFGILPPPKYDEAQEDYYCPVSYHWATFVTIPKTNSRLDLTGHMMEAMGYYSQQTVTPTYIDKTVQGKTLRDEESIEMLELILDNRVYELAAIYDWGGVNSIFDTIAHDPATQFASKYASIQKVADKMLSRTIDEIREALGD